NDGDTMSYRGLLDSWSIPTPEGRWSPTYVRSVNEKGEPTVSDISFPGSDTLRVEATAGGSLAASRLDVKTQPVRQPAPGRRS
ncbi:MAG: hypothetical protein OXC00_02080, partial [Acidimicrobiaceae bacterium]|nr:hypothetical protein [Acidimicrobiaceae bacterium]